MLEGEQNHLSQALVNLPQEEESDVDNYEEYMNNQFSIETHTNRQKMNSMISSQTPYQRTSKKYD